MSKIREKIKSNKLLILVFLIYIILGVAAPDKLVQSVKNSVYYIKEMLFIMPVILLLTSLIEAWVPQKTIQNNLGKDSGVKGVIFSFIVGSFSAGPIYAAFPVCKMLLKKGANIINIVIILSAWAVIKIPMLANESKFLGFKFMALRWVLTIASIFVIAYFVGRVVRRKDIPEDILQDQSAINSGLYIKQEYCIGCGICSRILPSHFEVQNKKAKVLRSKIDDEATEALNKAIEKCPAQAIEIIK